MTARRRSTTRLPFLAVALLALSAAPACAARAQARDRDPRIAETGYDTDSAAVLRVVTRFRDAMAGGDSAAVLALLAPDAVILESGGAEDVPEYRGHHLPADIEFARAVEETRKTLRVTVRGDLAWVAGTSTAKGQFRGRAVNSAGAELLVLVRTPAGWRIAAIHWSSRRL